MVVSGRRSRCSAGRDWEMGWKREGFKRRIRELSAEVDGDDRVYLSLDEIERDCAYNWDYTWRRLSKAWRVGRALGKSPMALQNEAEKWLAEIGVRQPGVISQAFLDIRVGHRMRNSKCEVSRFEIANDVLNASGRGTEHGGDELLAWHSDIVAEWADIYKTRFLADANHAILGWAESAGILPKLWSLYENGPRTTKDRNTLKALVVGITDASDEQAEAWISAKECVKVNSSGEKKDWGT